MAGDKSKKRAEKNTARLKLLFRTVAGSVLFHVLLRLVWKGSTASAWIHYPLFATAAFSDWFWLVALIIPGFATYKLWADIILPWIFTPTQDEMEKNARMKETKEERRKREKKEAKAENRRRGFR